MKEVIKELLKRGDFIQAVAEEMGKELVRQQTQDSFFSSDWNDKFYRALQETVNAAVAKEVNLYMEQYNVKDTIEHTIRVFLVKHISDILEEVK
jgi:hypothetical protein